MASGSSKAKQPSQKQKFAFPARMQAILNTPPEERLSTQEYMFEGLEVLNRVIPTLLDGVLDTVDIRSTKIIKALLELFQFLVMNGSLHCIIYFLGPKPAKKLFHNLDTICYRIINDKKAKYPKPEFLVPAFLACILASEVSLEEERKLEETGRKQPGERNDMLNVRAMKNVTLLGFFNELRREMPPAIVDDCNNYLRMKQGPETLTAKHLMSLFIGSTISIECLICMGRSPLLREPVESLLPIVELNVETLVSPSLVNIHPSYLALRISKFAPLTYQFKCLVNIYSRISPRISRSDPLSRRLWKAAEEFLKILKTGVNEASTKVLPVDYYNVANLNRLVLQSLVSGVSRTVCYTEIESVSNEIDKAVAACKDWASLDWIAEIEAELQSTKEVVLPFFQELNPGSYRTASVDVLATPGFLDLSTQAAKAAREGDRRPQKQQKKACAACGTRATELFKCNGCHTVSYCDKECQKKHWQAHKQACKEAQRG
jgi:hypothetical protein